MRQLDYLREVARAQLKQRHSNRARGNSEVLYSSPTTLKRIIDLHEVFTDKREKVLLIAARHGARNVRIFGSVARAEAGRDSDVDVLVDLEPGRSLFDLGGLLMDLQDLLGCRVDVVTEQGLRPRIRERVLREAVPL